MSPLLELLVAELERPREVSAQVIKHLVGTHGIAREDLGAFLVAEMPKLEDYEVELILAPLFTPMLKDQVVFAVSLGRTSVAADQWPALVQQLVARPTVGRLVTEDGVTHQVPLHEVMIERYLRRLRLEGTIADDVGRLISNLPQATDRAWLNAIARRAVWTPAGRREILSHYLVSIGDAFRADDAVALLQLTETYEPASMAELRARIPQWQQVLRQEINEGGVKPFFNERVEELHGGGRDQRRPENSSLRAKENELAFLERLDRVLH